MTPTTRFGEHAVGSRGRLRLRLRVWTVGVFGATLALSTAVAIVESRQRMVEVKKADATALLSHLAQMPEFQSDSRTATTRLVFLASSLREAGATAQLVPASGTSAAHSAWPVIASLPVDLRDGDYVLQYRSDPAVLQQLTRRTIGLHLLHGALALGALLVGAEWILRRNLIRPLERLAHAINRMRDGKDWAPDVGSTDEELSELARALVQLGPSLAQQVDTWLAVERRACVALAVAGIRKRADAPRCRALALMADLQSRASNLPEFETKLRALVLELGQISRAVFDEQDAWMMSDVVAASSAPLSGRDRGTWPRGGES